MSARQSAENDHTCPFCKSDPEALADAHAEGWRAGRDEGRREVADAFVAWAAKNEIAEPPLDWAWFGEIARRYSPLHEEHEPANHTARHDQRGGLRWLSHGPRTTR